MRRVPVRRPLTVERGDVAFGVHGVVLAQLVGDHGAVGADGAEQRTGQRARAGTRLEDAGSRKDVALVHDLGRVLRIDDLRAAGHREYVVHQQRTQHQERVAVGRLDHRALRLTKHRVVGNGAPVGMEFAARRKHHGVVPALGVGQLDTIANVERAGALHSRSACQPARHRRCPGLSATSHRLPP